MKLDASKIFEAFGEVSMCWNPKPTGVFQDTRAIEIIERLISELYKDNGIEFPKIEVDINKLREDCNEAGISLLGRD